MLRKRKKTRPVLVGDTGIGGGYPVSIQSMTNIPVEKVDESIAQIVALKNKGADIVRVALRDEDSVDYLRKIIESVEIPLVADIHFNYKIALKSIDAGIKKIRLNPGNIKNPDHLKEIVKSAKSSSIPIRIGVNAGSIDRDRYKEITPENLVASALDHIRLLEDNDFQDIVVSIKSSELHQTIEANRIFSEKRDYPVHIGLTEAGYGMSCVVQSSIAIGHLLMLGIGDTIRVSMTGDPLNELDVARSILESTGDRSTLIKIISCPTCGRTDGSLDILSLAREIETECMKRFAGTLTDMGRSLSVAVMGCEVNGPGEAREADAGIAGGRDGAVFLFSRGMKIRRIEKSTAVESLMRELEAVIEKMNQDEF